MLSLADVEAARAAIRSFLPVTPLRRSFAATEGNVWLKLESIQPTGSFKVRGALAAILALTADERARGIVAASAGNHALGVALAAETVGGVHATVFVPETAPSAKIDKLRRFQVELRVKGKTYDDSFAEASAFARASGALLVHAFEDPKVAAGQGTCGLEILDQLADVGTIVVPVGGGGLISGIATVVRARRPDVKVVAVQPDASPALADSLRQGRPLLEYAARPTLADGLAGGIGLIAWEHRALIDEVVVVPEQEIVDTVVALVRDDQILAEASGAVGVAALRAGRVRTRDTRPAVAVVTGANIEVGVLGRLLRDVT
jgi:threonine dehydratase